MKNNVRNLRSSFWKSFKLETIDSSAKIHGIGFLNGFST
jgi:hypothetical protein